MNENGIGSRWYKFDFHTHTPESSDYPSKADTPEEWLRACMDSGVDCVAVTDHVSGGWIDALKTTYGHIDKDAEWYRPLTIYPGVELTVSIGVARVHLLAIFDPASDSAKVTGVLGKCGIIEGHGDAQATFSSESIENIIKIVHEANGLLIPAHIDKEKGLLHGVVNTNNEIKGWISQLSAAEFVDHEFLGGVSEELAADAKHLAKVSGSDAHRLGDLGNRSTWIKMGDPSLDGLRLALHDHVFCVDNESANPNTIPNLYIDRLEVKSMAHCGRIPGNPAVFQLHPSFNAIIGGRGSGKSTFVESLRMSVGRVPELAKLPMIKSEVDAFVKGVALDDTVLHAYLSRRDEEYRCVWKDQGIQRIEKLNEGGWVEDHGVPGERFHISLYSQKQINALSSNPNSLLEIIDRSPDVDKSSWQRLYKDSVESFVAISQEVRNLESRISNEGSIQAQLEDVNSDISSFEEGGHGALFSEYQANSSINSMLDHAADLSGFRDVLSELSEFGLGELQLDNLMKDGELTENGKELSGIHEVFVGEVAAAKEGLKSIVERLDKAKEERSRSINQCGWAQGRDATYAKYNEVVAEYREKGEKLDPDEYEKWLTQRNELVAQLSKIESSKSLLKVKKEQRTKVYKRLYRMRRRLQQKRAKFINNVLGDNQYVRMTLLPFSDHLSMENQYRNHVGVETAFSTSILPDGEGSGLLSALKNDFPDLMGRVGAVEHVKMATRNLAAGSDVAGMKIDGRLKGALANRLEVQPESFDRLDAWWPDDKLVVEYARDPKSGKFANIEQGSAGQKAAAILAFLLSHGDNPIIVDQPEDDLDNALIYQLIVSQIHKNKKRRQIIVVTHNPNIVVNGDSELVNVLEFRGGQVQVLDCGGLSEQSIRNHICEIMEGGVEAFEKRYRRIALT